MVRLVICIPSVDKAEEFTTRIERLPYDLNLRIGNAIVDAKSILGILYLGLGKNIELEAQTDGEDVLREILAEFIVDENAEVQTYLPTDESKGTA